MSKAGQALTGLRLRSPYSFPPGAAMGRFGPPGFPASLIAVAALYTLFAAWRQATRRARMTGTDVV